MTKNANDCATLVLKQAVEAFNQNTFAVGGLLVDNATGEVICAMHNNVIKPLDNNVPFTYDPTAHGERQLIYWYYENKEALDLPEPSELTIITSLDPCAMCTGALLTAGFNVGVVALDTYAGINYEQNFKFNTLPQNLRLKAQDKFGYYGSSIRKYIGGSNVAFKNDRISDDNLLNCGEVFNKSVESVRTASNRGGEIRDPSELPITSPIIKAYQEVYSKAFTVKIDDYRSPDQQILNELQDVLSSASNAKNAVALIDQFGNLVLCMADTFDVSPVHAAFMNVTQAYAKTRWALMNEYNDTENYLTHPKYGTFVFLYAPDPSDSKTIMTLGAYGSTMEGQAMNPIQYFSDSNDLLSVIGDLPPFYTECVNILMKQVESTDDLNLSII